jgi:hypothetical protein
VLPIKLALEAMSDRDGSEFAWRVHDALDSWTAKVDTKASIALAIESAAFGFVVTLSAKEEVLASLHGWRHVLYAGGLGLMLFAVVLALSVVMPQLNRRRAAREWQDNMVYFGHLRHWDAAQLAERLGDANAPEYEAQLARQLVAMSKIAWRKHAWLQWSLVSLVAAASMLVVAGA